ncbi:hypothetical protein cypCar_00003879, partial [Cyprinus carpio]
MEAVLAKYENQINAFSDFLEDLPEVDEPVWILGACYDLKTRGTGPSSDAGWGCMLRCGQMILAQALVCRHLGRDWRWDPEKRQPKEYHRILHCFLDKKDSCYSIHQMAQMGVGEGKSVGEWYGPNTVAQVLKQVPFFFKIDIFKNNILLLDGFPGRESRSRAGPCGRGEVPASGQSCSEAQGRTLQSQRPLDWRPLLLVIPLRMGINSINPVYIQAFKECFKMPQSCGVLGGKPNLAYYFIGFIDDELIYLDPHTTQQAVDTESGSAVDDQSYHCQRTPHRMKITSLDPSVAL